MLFLIILLNLLAAIGANWSRHKRYLVYPDGGPARAQFIIGLGIPVDLKEQSVTVGTVVKFQYDLPDNSTEYTSRIYGFAETVSRNMDGDTENLGQADNKIVADASSKLGEIEDDETNDTERDNNTLVDITFVERRKRSLVYSEGGAINSIDTSDEKMTTQLPLQEAIKRQEMIDREYSKAEQEQEPQRMNRYDFYKIIEHMVERYGYTGRPCLLRTICEAAEVPFTHESGLLAEIGHILFTPSTTKDLLSHHTDNEYHAAERLGRDEGVDCETLFPECEGSVLETFTEIGMDTLHKFGFYN